MKAHVTTLFAALHLLPLISHAQTSCQIRDLGTLGGTESHATGINNLGWVVGYSTTSNNASTNAFLWDGSIMHDLGTLGGAASYAYGINDAGVVVGAYQSGATLRVFRGTMGSLADLGTFAGTSAIAYGVNAQGDVVGSVTVGGVDHAFANTSAGFQDLGPGIARKINSNGQIAGNDGFWDASGFHQIGLNSNNHAMGINESGAVVGYYLNGDWYTGYLWRSTNDFSRYVPGVANPSNSWPYVYYLEIYGDAAVNDFGTIACTFHDIYTGAYNEGGAILSGEYVYIGHRQTIPGEWLVKTATAINNSNLVVGDGIISNQTHAYLATMIPGTSPPAITQQPQSLTTNALSWVTLTIGVSGSIPLSIQWQHEATNIPGATWTSLDIPEFYPTNLGSYSVIVSNPWGTVVSSNAVLSMYPFIRTPFSGAIAYWGRDATLAITAWGTPPLSYQWYKDGVAIPGATADALFLPSVQSSNAGLYSVVVSNAFGTVTNQPAQLVINPAGTSLGLYPGLTLSGTVGYKYLIQSTTDLRDTNSWQTLTNLTLADPIQLWIDTSTDTTSPTNRQRFYRVLPGN